MTTTVLPNHIEEYLKSRVDNVEFENLFEANEEDVDLKTDLSVEEIWLINTLFFTEDFLSDLGVKDVYSGFIDEYLRLKISKDRLSRAEFVDINKKERFENNLSKFNAFSNLSKVKE